MKLRSDFVSNSSSCSFVIRDIEKAGKLLAEDLFKKFPDIHFASDFYDLTCSAIVDKDNVKALNRAFGREGSSEDNCYHSYGCAEDERCIEELSSETVLRAMAEKPDEIAKLAKSLTFTTEDYNRACVNSLMLLLKYFTVNNVEAENPSDVEFSEDTDFDAALRTCISERARK